MGLAQIDDSSLVVHTKLFFLILNKINFLIYLYSTFEEADIIARTLVKFESDNK